MKTILDEEFLSKLNEQTGQNAKQSDSEITQKDVITEHRSDSRRSRQHSTNNDEESEAQKKREMRNDLIYRIAINVIEQLNEQRKAKNCPSNIR